MFVNIKDAFSQGNNRLFFGKVLEILEGAIIITKASHMFQIGLLFHSLENIVRGRVVAPKPRSRSIIKNAKCSSPRSANAKQTTTTTEVI